MNIDCGRNAAPRQQLYESLSSKVQALLHDLPLGEHAVVFSSSKEGVLHLSAVMEARGINRFSLFVGQNALTTEKSVSSWQNLELDPKKVGPVLIVQAGAAASGLTLTAASKLFLMEPFTRQEEEQQAYARCHRYGQTRDVHVKIYHAPVSVESRLLCWRKRAQRQVGDAGANANYVFTELFEKDQDMSESDGDDDDDGDGEGMIDEAGSNEGNDDDEEANVDDSRRTQFLLGLIDENGNPVEDDDDDGPDRRKSDDDRKPAARRFILE